MLKIQEFIKSHDDWEQLLIEKPYCLKITRDTVEGINLIIFKYNQIESDFHNELVRECRGLILNENTLEAVSVPFFKFGNYGEGYVPNIDWKSAVINQKIDGSLIKIIKLFDDKLLISTNGTIDSSKAQVVQGFGCPYESYRDLVLASEQIKELGLDGLAKLLDYDMTYMFELTSPYNKIVIPYEGINLTFIGIRDNKTLEEGSIYGHKLSQYFPTPKRYSFSSFDDCVKSSQELPYDDEGYVVADKNFNRVKVKSAAYVAIHHLKGEGILTPKKAVELLRMNEVAEYLTYFEEYKADFEKLGNKYDGLVADVENEWAKHSEKILGMDTKKEQALYINANLKYKTYAFNMICGRESTARQFVGGLSEDIVLKLMEEIYG